MVSQFSKKERQMHSIQVLWWLETHSSVIIMDSFYLPSCFRSNLGEQPIFSRLFFSGGELLKQPFFNPAALHAERLIFLHKHTFMQLSKGKVQQLTDFYHESSQFFFSLLQCCVIHLFMDSLLSSTLQLNWRLSENCWTEIKGKLLMLWTAHRFRTLNVTNNTEQPVREP